MTLFALIVGINDYPARTKQQALRGAVADAAAFAEWALSPAGGVEPANLYLWTHPAPEPVPGGQLESFLAQPAPPPWAEADFTRAPTSDDIWLLVDGLAAKAETEKASRVYIYFAGHGVLTVPLTADQRGESCFLPGDYLPPIPSKNLIACGDILRTFVYRGIEAVMFQDCCRSPLPSNVQSPASPLKMRPAAAIDTHFLAARSAQPGRLAYEIPVDAPNRGAFTFHLISGLQHRNPTTGALLASELDDYVTAGLSDALTSANLQQTPDFSESYPAAHRFELFNTPPAPPAPSPASPGARGPAEGAWKLGDAVADFDLGGATEPASEVDAGTIAASGMPKDAVIAVDLTGQQPGEFELLDYRADVIEIIRGGMTWERPLPSGGYALRRRSDGEVHSFNHVGPEKTDVRFAAA